MANICCCGCTYKTGAIMVLTLGLLANTISIITLIVSLAIRTSGVKDTSIPFYHSYPQVWIPQVLWTGISLALNVILAIGIAQNKSSFVRRWITGTITYVSLGALTFVIGMLVALAHGFGQQGQAFGQLCAGALGVLIAYAYCIHIVRRFWERMILTK